MRGKTSYVIALTLDGVHPHVSTWSEPDTMYDFLSDYRNEVRILDARRVVVTASGSVNYAEVRIDVDDGRLAIYDKYGTLIERWEF